MGRKCRSVNSVLVKSLLALLPVSALLAGSARSFFANKTAFRLLQLAGAGCLLVVVLAHISEGLHLLAWMGWGEEQSLGHYLDLSSAILGVTLFPAGYLLQSLRESSK